MQFNGERRRCSGDRDVCCRPGVVEGVVFTRRGGAEEARARSIHRAFVARFAARTSDTPLMSFDGRAFSVVF